MSRFQDSPRSDAVKGNASRSLLARVSAFSDGALLSCPEIEVVLRGMSFIQGSAWLVVREGVVAQSYLFGTPAPRKPGFGNHRSPLRSSPKLKFEV